MPSKIAALGLAAALALSPLAALAQADQSGAAMTDKTMAPAKPMAKPHSMHKKHMSKTMMHSDKMNDSGEAKKM
jgi:hypothetical protein